MEEEVTEALMAPGKIPGSSGTRNLRDNLSDLRAQVAANQKVRSGRGKGWGRERGRGTRERRQCCEMREWNAW